MTTPEIRKSGRIFQPDRQYDWIRSHGTDPVPYRLDGTRYRIYFGARNERNHTQIGYLEIDIEAPQEILTVSEEPILETGDLGTFDDSGLFPSWIVERDGGIYLYYNGWTVPDTVPYHSNIGVAVSHDGGETFERWSKGPILGRNPHDPYIVGGPCVRYESGKWRMWYSSAHDFRRTNDGPMYYYEVTYAESEDGLHWTPTGEVCVPHVHENETRIAWPCVRKTDSGYEMWYSYAIGHEGYRIGYATSDDGVDWTRHDEDVPLSPSEEGWDSEMTAHPYVFDHEGMTYMLYIGNGYGETGFGLATVEGRDTGYADG